MTRVVVAGGVARRPGRGGHVWAFMQWVLGLRRLGLEAVFVDCVEGTADGLHGAARGGTGALDAFSSTMERFGLSERFCVLLPTGGSVGMRRAQLEQRARGALLLNFMGYLEDPGILGLVGRRVFVDIDPGFPQMWSALGLADLLSGHDSFVTVGANVGGPGCAVPTCGRTWLTTPPPVVLEQWPATWVHDGAFRSVASWRGPFDPVEFGGRIYGLRAHEFRAFADLPRLAGGGLEVALDIDPADADDRRRLLEGGWVLSDPGAVAGDPWSYREFVQQAAGEFSVAKAMYVQSGSGWFSDRSVCFLASGKPVVTQETGWTSYYPSGEGLLAYGDAPGAAGAIGEVRGHYRRHSRAARALAEAHFDSDLVIGRLLDHLA